MRKNTKNYNELTNAQSLKNGITSFYPIYVALITCALSLFSPTSLANPQGGVVSAGSATISSSGNTVQIHQTSDKAVVDWRSYNISQHETTQYVQPSAKSITLNRIDPNNGASVIAGRLQANGQVWLVNPAGIMFTSTARVDVAGLLATTANITNEDFMAGNYRFVQDPNWNGAVVNNGEITIRDEGIAMLVAPGVENNGVIRANLGKVVLASGTAYTVDFYGDQLINFAANSEVKSPAKDANGRVLQHAVSNTGQIYANGGSVLMTARTASGVLDNVINMSGVVEAKTAVQRGGSIILSGGDNGTVRVSGKMIASGKQYAQKGGSVKVLGKKVRLVKRAYIDVSGDAGGGEILIGGDYQGKNPKVQNAESTFVGKHVTINANALRNGNGGKVIVWANDNTHFYGSIFARGGSEGGDGGFVETSGKSYLDVNHARVNTLAPKGNTGTWLLDPTNIYIATNLANAQAAGMTGSDSSASIALSSTFAGLGGIQDSLLTTGNLTTALASSNVVVSTTNAGGTGVGNITIVDPFSWSSTNSLTLTAANNIVINAAITTGAAGSSLVLNATGAVTQTAAIGGSGSLVQQGSGTATLSLANTFSGGTSITAGTLSVTHTNGLGTSGAIQVSNSGVLDVNLSGNTLANSSALTLSNSADLISSVAASSTDTLNNAITLTAGGTPIITSTNANATLSLTSSITNNTAALTLNGDGNITIGGVIGAGAGTLTMSSTGTLTLTAANTYSGATTINAGNVLLNGANGAATSTTFTINEGGTLTLDNSANNNTNRISDANALTLNGGEFVFKGSNVAATNASESVGALTLPLGASTVTTFSGTGGTTILTFSSLSRSNGATVLFRGIGQTNNAAPAAGTANIRFTAAPAVLPGNGQLVGAGALNTTSAPMMPFAFGDTSTSGVGTDFVTYDTGSNTTGMRLLVAAEYTGALTAGTNVKLTSSVTPGANVAINSLLIATGGTLAFPANNRTITLTSGALGSTGGSGVTSDATNGRVIALAGVEGKIFAINNFTIQSNISNTAASPGLTLSGGGTLTFNTQVKGMSNGSYTINEGSLVGGIANAINSGTSVAILDKGTLDLSTFAESITGLTVYSGLTSGASITGSGALTIGNGNILVNSNSTGATGATISAPLTFGGTRTITVNDGAATNDLSISSVISGTGGLTKSGAGTLNLSGLNAYTGVTTVSAGTLSFDTIQSVSGGASSLGAPTTGANGTIALGATGILKYTGSGHTSNRIINLTADGGTIDASGSGTLTLSGNVTGNTFDLNLIGTGTGIASGVIGTTTGTVTKSGTGTWTLSNAANTYTGITTVNAGQLNASTLANQSSNSSIGTNTLLINGGIFSYTGGTVSVTRNLAVGANGGTLQATTNGATLTLTGTLNPAGAGGGANPLIIDVNPGSITLNPGTITTALSDLTVTGSGTGTLLLSKTGIFTGSTTVTSGSLKIGVANTLPTATTLSVTSSGVFDLNGVAQTVGILVGNGTVTNTGAAATLTDNEANTHIFAGAINGATALTMAGTGTLTLSGTNSAYTGATTISAGTLSIASVANSGANSSIGTGSVTPTIALSGTGTLQYTGSGHSSDRVINLTSSGGTIDASGSGALTLSGGITGNTFNLVLTGTGSATQSGVINTTTGTLTKNGTGTWTLSGANSYSGTSSITAGLLIANNNSALGSNSLSIASNGTLQINNGITINNDITSISGTGSASQGALFGSGSGTSTYGGTMTLGAASTIGSGAGNTFNLTNTINNGGFLATFDANTGNISASNTISGAGGLTKSGSGTLTLSSTNSSYAGATTISAGILSVAALDNTGNNSSIGTGSGTSTIALSGTGTLQYTGSGHSSNRVINLTSSGGTIDTSGSGELMLSGGITGNTFNLVLTGSGSATQSGVINTTTGTLTKNGTGTWKLSGTNSYSGTSSITAGLLIANNNSALGSNSASIASTSTLQINNGITINNDISSLSGTGSALQGALYGSGSGISTFSGTLILGNVARIGSGAGNTFNLSNTINNSGFLATFDANTGNINASNVISGAGGLRKIGNGSLTLSSTNSSYSGPTTISAGILSVASLENSGTNSSIGTGSGTPTIALSATGILQYTGSGHSSNRIINLTSSGGTIDASGSGALTLTGGITGNAFNLVLTGSGSASQNGDINTTTGTLTKSGTGTWNLGGTNTYSGTTSITTGSLSLTNVAALGSSSSTTVSSGGNLNINFSSGTTLGNTNTITLNGTGSGTGALTLSSANITLNNPIALASTSTIGGAGTGTMTLGGNITGTAVNLTINLTNAGLSLPSTTLTTSGNLSVTTNGAITQTGALTIPGTSSFSAGANPITLTNTSNSLTGAVTLSNSSTNDVSLTNSIALQIAGATVGRDLNLTAGGSITQSGVINSSNGTLTAIVTAATSDILLQTQANNLGAGGLVFGGTAGNKANIRDVGIRNTSSSASLSSFSGLTNIRNLTIQFDNAGITFPSITLTNSGSLTAIAGGAIQQSARIIVPGSASFNAGANSITLLSSANDVDGGVSFITTGANDASFRNNSALQLDTSNVGGNLSITAVNAISQLGALTVGGTSSFTTSGASDTITLTNAGNLFVGAVSLQNAGTANDVSITNNTALILGTSSISGNFNLIAGGSISQTGAIDAGNGVVTATVNSTNSDILLDTQDNNLGSSALAFSGTLTNIRDLGIQNNNSAAVSPSFTGLTLRNLSLIFTGNKIILPALTLNSGGNLTVSARGVTGGAITQTGALVVPGTSSFSSTLGTSAQRSITLTNSGNQFTGVVSLTTNGTGDVSIANSLALSLGNSSLGTGDLTLNGVGISQVGGSSITQLSGAGAVTLTANTGVINLSNSNNDFTGTVSATNSAANAVSITDSTALSVGNFTLTGASNLALNAVGITQANGTTINSGSGTISISGGGGALNFGSGSITTTNNTASALSIVNGTTLTLGTTTISSGTITLGAGDITGAITQSGATILTANNLTANTTSNITLSNNNVIPNLGAITAGGSFTFNDNSALVVNNAISASTSVSPLSITATGLLTISGNITSSAGSNGISLTGVGITQSGSVTVNASAGALTYNAGTGTITTNASSLLLSTGTINLIANNMVFNSAGQIGGTGAGAGTAATTILRQSTNGTAINIENGAAALSLTQTELNTIRSTNVRIGDSNSGLITIGAWTPAATFAPNLLTLQTGSSGITTTGAITLGANSNLLIRSAGGVSLTNSNVFTNIAATLSSGSLSVTNAATNPIVVTSLTDDVGTVNGITAPGGVTINTSGSGGSITVNQNISTTNTAVTLNGIGITLAGSTTIDSGSGAISLNAGTGSLGLNASSIVLTTGTLTLNADSMAFNTSSQLGGSGVGAGRAATIIITPNTAGTTIGLAGGAGSLNLDANELATLRGTNIRIGDSNTGAMTIASSTWTPGANFAPTTLTLFANGITQGAGINLATSTSDLIIRGAGAVTLTNSNNVFDNIAATKSSGSFSVTNATTNPLTVTSLSDDIGTVDGITTPANISLSSSGTGGLLTIGAAITSSSNAINLAGQGVSLLGNVTVNSGAAALAVNAGNGNLDLNANSLLLSSATITLTADTMSFASSSQIGGSGVATGSATNAILQPSTAATTIGLAGASGTLNLTDAELDDVFAQKVRIGNSTAGALVTAAYTPAANFATSTLTLDTGASITQTGKLDLSTSGSSLLLRDASGVVLDNNSNIFSSVAANIAGPLTIVNQSTNPLTIASLSDDLGTVNGITASGAVNITASGSGGSLTLNQGITSNNGNIVLSGVGFTQAASTTVNSGSGTIAINGGGAAIQFNTGTLSSTNTGASAITISNGTTIALGNINSSGGLSVTSNGAITDNGASIISGAATFDAGATTNNITLDNSNNFNSIAITQANNVIVNDINAIGLDSSTISGTFAVVTSGNITQSAALSVTGATTLTANGATSDITLNNASNNFSSIGFAAARNVSVTDANALALNASTISGTLAVVTSGNITQNAALTVTGATTLTANGATSDITLNSANDFDSIGFAAARNVSVTDANALALNASTLSGTLDITAGGHITQNGALDVTGAATFTVSAANSDILLASAANTFSSTSFATTGAGTVRDLALRNIAPTATIPALPAGLRDLTLIFDNAAIDLPSTSLTGNLSVTAGGAITDSGTLVVAGTSTFAAGSSNNITLDTATNNFASVGITSGNNVALVDVDALALNISTISGTLTVTTSGNITQNGALTVTGATTLTANGATSDITLNSANDFSSIGFVAARNVSVTDANALALNASTISGTLAVVTSGNITQNAALAVTGATTLTANGATSDITLNNASNNFSSIGFAAARNVSVTDANALALNASTISGTLAVVTSGNITQNAALTVTGATTLTANGATSDITLNSANNFSSISFAAARNVSVTDANALALNASTISGTLAVVTSGNITQNAALTVTGATTLTANGATSDITLNSANDFSSIGFAAARNVSVTDANALALNASTISGTLAVVTSGSITQNAALTVTGATTLTANGATSDITLNSANDFSSIGFAAARNVSVTDASDLALNASTVTGTFDITAGGHITQNGALDITGAATFTVSAANSDILLASAANTFSSTSFATTGAGTVRDLALRNIASSATIPALPAGLRNLTLIFDNAAIDLPSTSLTGDLSVTAGGAITDSGTLVVAGTSTFAAGSSNNITLDTATNDFASAGITSGNNVILVDANALALNTSTISGTLSVTTTGNITQNGALTVTGATTLTANGATSDITLNSANNFSSIGFAAARNVSVTDANALALNASTISGTLAVVTSGNITQNAALTVTGATTLTANGATSDITLNSANDFSSIGFAAARNVSVTDANALALNASTISGTLAVVTSGNITQNGALTVTGATTLTANGATSDITLNSANNFSSIGFAAARNVSVTDANALALNTSTISGTLAVVTSGNITQNAALTVTGATTLTANGATSDITLNSSNDFSSIGFAAARNVSVTDANALALNASTISGTLAVVTSGNITQNAALSVTGATTLTANGATSDITLNSSNDFSSIGFAAARNVSVTDANALALNASTISGTLAVATSGNITQNAALTVTGATTLTANGATSDITLNSANDFSSIGFVAARNVSVTDANALALNASTISGTFDVTTGGQLSQTAALDVTGNATFTATAADTDILLASAANTFSGSVTFANSGGTIQDIEFRNIFATAAFPTLPTGLRNLTIVFNNAGINLPAITLSGNLSVTAGGTITDSGALIIAGTSTFAAGSSNNITLDTATNNFASVGITSGNNVILVDANALALNTSTISGTLAVTTSGNITQNGALDVTGAATFTVSAANSDILLASAANTFSSTSFATTGAGTVRDLALRNIAPTATIPALPAGLRDLTLIFDNAAIDLPSTSLTGNLSVTAGGAITDSGTLVVAGTSTFAAGSSNNITLDTATNNFASVGITSGNNVTLVDVNTLALNTSTVSGTLAVVTTTGNITQNGALIVTGATTLTANIATGDITLNSANNFSSIGFAAARNVSVTDANALALNASTISGTLAVTTAGNITQNGALTVTGATTLTANGATSDITLNSANDFSSIGFVTTRNVSVTDANALALNASTISGTLAVVTSGNITQNAALSVTGATTLTANGATSDITLNNSSNDFSSIGFAAARNVSMTDANALALNASTVSGTLAIVTSGSITQNAALTVTGATTLTANGATSDITLNSANDFSSIGFAAARNVSVTDANSLALNASTVSGTLAIVTSGNITQNAALTVTGATTLTANGATSDIALNSANDFSSIGFTAARNVSVTDVNSLALNASAVSGNLSVITGGDITQNGALSITGAATFTVSASNSDILLASAANSFSSTSFATTGVGTVQDLALRNIASSASLPVLPSGLRNLTLTFDNAAIDLPSTNLTGDLSVTAGGAITGSGTLVIAGSSTFSAGTTNNITLNTATNDFNSIGILSGNNVTIVDTNALVVDSSSTNGSLSITANDTIEVQSGALINAGGALTLQGNLGNGNIIINGSMQSHGDMIITPAGTGNIQIGASSLASNGGAMTFSSPIVLNNNLSLESTNGNMTLNGLSGAFNLALNSGSLGNITFNNATNINNMTVVNTNDLTNNGTITVTNYQQSAGNTANLGTNTLIVNNGFASITSNNILGRVVVNNGNFTGISTNLNITLNVSNGNATINSTNVNSNITTTGTTVITGYSAFGTVNVGGLTLNVTGPINLSGSVGGSTGAAAIAKINFVIPPMGLQFFDGIDLGLARIATTQLAGRIVNVSNPNNVQNVFPTFIENQTGTSLAAASGTLISIVGTGANIPQTLNAARAIPSFTTPASYFRNGLPKIWGTAPMGSAPYGLGAGGSSAALSGSRLFGLARGLAVAPEAIGIGYGILASLAALLAGLSEAIRRFFDKTKYVAQDRFIEFSFNIRTELNNILSAAGLIYSEKLCKIPASQKEFFNDIMNSSNQMNDYLERLEQANKLPITSLSKISFDLRTYLEGINGFTELMKNGKAGPVAAELKEYLIDILNSAHSILGMIKDITHRADKPAKLFRETESALEYAGGASFMLRTHLTNITGYAEVMQSNIYGVATPMQKELLNEIIASVQHAQTELAHFEQTKPDRHFVKELSFKLRTALNGMMVSAQLMQDGKTGPVSQENKECVEYILVESKTILQFLSNPVLQVDTPKELVLAIINFY